MIITACLFLSEDHPWFFYFYFEHFVLIFGSNVNAVVVLNSTKRER